MGPRPWDCECLPAAVDERTCECLSWDCECLPTVSIVLVIAVVVDHVVVSFIAIVTFSFWLSDRYRYRRLSLLFVVVVVRHKNDELAKHARPAMGWRIIT